MTDADRKLCREMFDVVAPAGAADFKKRAVAELRLLEKHERAIGVSAREAVVRMAITMIERLPLTVTP